MDMYCHWIAHLLLFFNPEWTHAAITIGQTTYYSCPAEQVDKAWHAHEDEHKKQWAREGWVCFLAKYLWWSWKYGYEKNPLEVEAQEAAAKVCT